MDCYLTIDPCWLKFNPAVPFLFLREAASPCMLSGPIDPTPNAVRYALPILRLSTAAQQTRLWLSKVSFLLDPTRNRLSHF